MTIHLSTDVLNSSVPRSSETSNPFRTEAEDRFVKSLAKSIRTRAQETNRAIYFVTTTYIESKDFPLTADVATNNFKRFHHRLLQHLARTHRINRPWFKEQEPFIYAFLDRPGSKSKHYKLNSVSKHESTFHHHSIVIANERHIPILDALIDKKRDDDSTDRQAAEMFAQENRFPCRLRSIHVRRLLSDEQLERTVSYASAYAQKHQDDINSLLLFPKSQSELH